MAERLVSKYKFNSVASKKKHIFSRLLDYFSLFVVTYIVFMISFTISGNLPVMKNISNNLNKINYEVAEYIDSTHLQRLNADKNGLISLEESAEVYVKNVAKTCAYIYEKPFYQKQSDGTYQEIEINKEETFVYDLDNYPLDPLCFYFIKFKSEDPSLNDYGDFDDKEQYLFNYIITSDESNFITVDDEHYITRAEGLSHYNILSEELTDVIINYYHGDTLNTTAHKLLYMRYINAVQKGIKEVEKKSATYLSYMNKYAAVNNQLIGALALIYFLSYLFSYLALTGILRLICKEWTTLGQKVMGLAICDNHENEPSAIRLVCYHLISFVLFFSSSALGLYFTGLPGVLSFKLIPHISILWIDIGLITLNVISLFMPLFNKNRYDLSTLITRIFIKDIKEFEGSAEVLNAIEEGKVVDDSGTDGEQQ